MAIWQPLPRGAGFISRKLMIELSLLREEVPGNICEGNYRIQLSVFCDIEIIAALLSAAAFGDKRLISPVGVFALKSWGRNRGESCPCGGFLVTSQLPGSEPGEVETLILCMSRVVPLVVGVQALSASENFCYRGMLTAQAHVIFLWDLIRHRDISIGNHLLSLFIISLWRLWKNAIYGL